MKLPRSMVVFWVNPLTNELHKGQLATAVYGERGVREFFTSASEAVEAHLADRANTDAKLRAQVSQTASRKGT